MGDEEEEKTKGWVLQENTEGKESIEREDWRIS